MKSPNNTNNFTTSSNNSYLLENDKDCQMINENIYN